ncbi:MAG: antitoxin [Acidobacteria bacterium]|nr:MAG: antitoxin [Acidobacteriota bacterium]
MRTTINIDDDVLELARAVAAARQVSLGAAVSYLVRRGASARMPQGIRNGFHTFAIEPGLLPFGPDEIGEALDEEDLSSAPLFLRQE